MFIGPRNSFLTFIETPEAQVQRTKTSDKNSLQIYAKFGKWKKEKLIKNCENSQNK